MLRLAQLILGKRHLTGKVRIVNLKYCRKKAYNRHNAFTVMLKLGDAEISALGL